MERLRNKDGTFQPIHGGKNTRLYRVWCAMKERCSDRNNKRYIRYGARGITVCEEWKNDFQAFYDWAMANGYQEGLTIDRIDNNGNYEPNNCRFVTRQEQNRNYSRNHLLTYNGETLCLADMANKYGINRATLLYRLNSGKTIEEALTKIDRRKRNGAKQ